VMADFFNIAPGTANLSVDVGHYTLPDVMRIPRSNSAESQVTLGTFSAP
jgi:hypothetical protein